MHLFFVIRTSHKLSLTIVQLWHVSPYAEHFLVLCLVPQFLQLNILIGGRFFSLSDGFFFLNDGLVFPFSIPCTAGSFSSSFRCLSVASAGRTTSGAFSSVRSCTLSNLSLVFFSCLLQAQFELWQESSSPFQIHIFLEIQVPLAFLFGV